MNYRALTDLFNLATQRGDHSDFEIGVSMMEVYNEVLRDLIYDADSDGISPTAAANKATAPPKLEIRKHPTSPSPNAVYVPGLTCVSVKTVDEVWELLERGSKNRSQHATDMNEHSSRSHLILSVNVTAVNRASGVRRCGTLSLVDLAGSERLSRSNAEGDRLKEAQHINKSLATLGDVFMGLLEKSSYIPYRNSKLTYLLQESLGGDSKTLMFVNTSCDEADVNETVSSLTFAQRVARVEKGAAQSHASTNAGNASSRGGIGGISSSVAQEKDAQITALQSKLVVSERECRKRVGEVDELKERVDATQAELKASGKLLDEKKRREVTENKSATAATAAALREVKELKATEDKLKKDLAAARQKVREVGSAKEEQIRQMKSSMDDITAKLRRVEREKKGANSTPRVGSAVPRGATFRTLPSREREPPATPAAETPKVPVRSRMPSRTTPAAQTFTNGDASRQVRFPSPNSLETQLSTPPPASEGDGEIAGPGKRSDVPSDANADTGEQSEAGDGDQTGIIYSIESSGATPAPKRRPGTGIPRPKSFTGTPSARPTAAGSGSSTVPGARKRVVYAFGTRVEVKDSGSQPGGGTSRSAAQLRPARRAATTLGVGRYPKPQKARPTVNGPRRAAPVLTSQSSQENAN